MATTTIPLTYPNIMTFFEKEDFYRQKAGRSFHSATKLPAILATVATAVTLVATYVIFQCSILTLVSMAAIGVILIHKYVVPRYEPGKECADFLALAEKIHQTKVLFKKFHKEQIGALISQRQRILQAGLKAEDSLIWRIPPPFYNVSPQRQKNTLSALLAQYSWHLKTYESSQKDFQQRCKTYLSCSENEKKGEFLEKVLEAHITMIQKTKDLVLAKALLSRPLFSGKVEDVVTEHNPANALRLSLYGKGITVLTLNHLRKVLMIPSHSLEYYQSADFLSGQSLTELAKRVIAAIDQFNDTNTELARTPQRLAAAETAP